MLLNQMYFLYFINVIKTGTQIKILCSLEIQTY